MDSIIYTRTKELCDERGISITKLESELGLGQYSIGNLKNSSNPTIKTAVRIAAYFGVSVDYLIGASDIRTKADDLAQDSDFVSIQRARERMTDVDRDRMMAMLQVAFDKAFEDKTTSIERFIHSRNADILATGLAAVATGMAAGGAVVAASNPVTAPLTVPLAGVAAASAGVMMSKDEKDKKRKTPRSKKE